VTDRIIRDCGEVDDSIKAKKITNSGAADVTGALLVSAGRGTEVATVVPPRVQSDHVMTRSKEKRDHHSTQITAISCNQHSHRTPLLR
jgi:hypothetical protein